MEQPRILTRQGALKAGFTQAALDHKLATGRWIRLLPRTYLTSDTVTEHDRLEAALAYAGRGAALSGTSALRQIGIGRLPPSERVLVVVPGVNKTGSRDFVHVVRSLRPYRVQRAGVICVHTARAVADYALRCPRLDDVRTIVARAVGSGRCTVDELTAELETGPRRGSALLRRVLIEVGDGAESAPEARAATLLRRARIRGFQQNVTLRLPDGRCRRVDFWWPAMRAALEIESVEYHFDPADWRSTWNRHLELTTLGISVIHRPPSALNDPRRFVRDVRGWLVARERELRSA